MNTFIRSGDASECRAKRSDAVLTKENYIHFICISCIHMISIILDDQNGSQLNETNELR